MVATQTLSERDVVFDSKAVDGILIMLLKFLLIPN